MKVYYAMDELLKWEEGTSSLPNVLAYFSVAELLKMKRVSRKWRVMCTRAINSKCPSPPKAFQSNQELCDAVTKWYTYDPEAMEELACTYGYPINKWDVSRVTDFSLVFLYKKNFNDYIGDWDVSNATKMCYMFSYTKKFNQPLTNWNTSKVTDIRGMFLFTRAFNQSLASWNCSNVTVNSAMFHDARAFTHFDTLPVELEDWHVDDDDE